MKMRKPLIQQLGWLGLVSLLSYLAAVLFAPTAYPGYRWMQQAVSDLSAVNAPSRDLWNRLSCLYVPCGLVSLMMSCVFIQKKHSRALRLGVYLFTGMNWLSAAGYTLFPLTDSGYAGTVQDGLHLAVTALVVVLSITSLVLVMVGGYRRRAMVSLAMWASVALGMMFIGAVGSGLAPKAIFGVMERFSLFAAVGFTAVLGIYLMRGYPEKAQV